LAATNTVAGDIAAYSAVSVVVKQTGIYQINYNTVGNSTGASMVLNAFIKTGSATYGSATQKSASASQDATAAQSINCSGSIIARVNNGDTIHLGISMAAASGNRIIYGDDTQVGITTLTFKRID
jgi:hypothetical protein